MKTNYRIKNRTGMRLGNKNEFVGLLFLIPSLILFLIFKYYPILSGIFISFFEIDIVNLPGKFTGFDNYIRAFRDPMFYATLWHTIKGFIYAVLMNFWPPILLAILIDEIRRGKSFYRLMYFIPAVAPAIAMTIVWKFFWNPDFGLANYLIGLLGFEPQLWLNSKKWVYFCMHLPGFLIAGGMNMVIYLAALQDVPGEQYEAAFLEGAGVVRRIWHVTLPNIRNQIGALFLLAMIGAFQSLEGVMVLTGGGPAGSTETVLLYAYKAATNNMDYSYAITISTIIFFVVLILTAITNRKPAER